MTTAKRGRHRVKTKKQGRKRRVEINQKCRIGGHIGRTIKTIKIKEEEEGQAR